RQTGPHSGTVIGRTLRHFELGRGLQHTTEFRKRIAAFATLSDVRLDFAARCPIGIVKRVGDELFFGNVHHELALTSGASSRRILATARKMLWRVAVGLCPNATLISSTGRCSRCLSV